MDEKLIKICVGVGISITVICLISWYISKREKEAEKIGYKSGFNARGKITEELEKKMKAEKQESDNKIINLEKEIKIVKSSNEKTLKEYMKFLFKVKDIKDIDITNITEEDIEKIINAPINPVIEALIKKLNSIKDKEKYETFKQVIIKLCGDDNEFLNFA